MNNYYKFQLDFYYGVVTNHTLNTSSSFEIQINPFSLMRVIIIVNIESRKWYEVVGGKPHSGYQFI